MLALPTHAGPANPCWPCRRPRVLHLGPVVAPVPSALVVPVVVAWLASTLPRVRYKTLPARLLGGASGTKLSLHA